MGEALNRSGADYRGDEQRRILPGISKEVKYFEVHWSRERFGVKSKTTSDAVERLSENASRQSGAAGATGGGWQKGSVRLWDVVKGFGFIANEGGDFYFNRTLTIGDHPLSAETEVFFTATPPLKPGASPAAACVLALGRQFME